MCGENPAKFKRSSGTENKSSLKGQKKHFSSLSFSLWVKVTFSSYTHIWEKGKNGILVTFNAWFQKDVFSEIRSVQKVLESFTVARLNSVNLFDGTNPHYCCLRQGKTEAASAPFSHILFPFLRGWEMKRHFLGKNSLRRILRSISYSDAPVTQNDYYSVPRLFWGGD